MGKTILWFCIGFVLGFLASEWMELDMERLGVAHAPVHEAPPVRQVP